MKFHDLGSSLFWLMMGLLISMESLRLDIGTLQKPGRGFITFGTGVLLGILSLVLLIQSLWKQDRKQLSPLFYGTLWKKVVLVLSSLFLYGLLMTKGGYLLTTFMLTTFLFWVIEKTRMLWVLALSLLTTIFSYYIFGHLLNVSFPTGFLGF